MAAAVITVFVAAPETFAEIVVVFARINIIAIITVARILIGIGILVIIIPPVFAVCASGTIARFIAVLDGVLKLLIAVIAGVVVITVAAIAIVVIQIIVITPLI